MYYVYIMASRKNGTLYVGVTSDLIKRVHQHKSGNHDSFTKKYNVNQLVYYEEVKEINSAITREKGLKALHRQWKIELIKKKNPDWRDLYTEILS